MQDRRSGTPDPEKGEAGEPTPRDMPDQQADPDGPGEDPWEPDGDTTGEQERARPDPALPDTDEAGTGRRGAPHAASPNPEHPVPDEPAD
ncbi:hypothetical protein [Streptomyces xanthii]